METKSINRQKTFLCLIRQFLAKINPFRSKEKNLAEAYSKLEVIAESFKGTWNPDWSDKSQFSYHTSENDISHRASRNLHYNSKETADYSGQKFAEMYKSFQERINTPVPSVWKIFKNGFVFKDEYGKRNWEGLFVGIGCYMIVFAFTMAVLIALFHN